MRHPTRTELKFGVKKDGTIVAKQAKVVMDNGAYNSHGPAVIAYNHFQNRIKVLGDEIDNFTADFLNLVGRHFMSM